MTQPDEKHLEPYRQAVERFGPTFEATLWRSPEAQNLRFDVMIDLIGSDAMDGSAILDIGCGMGDLAQRLIDQEIPFARYVGLDALPEMIEAAQARNLPRCEFAAANVLSDVSILKNLDADFAMISGTLNTMEDASAQRVVQGAFDASAQGVAFNFLSDRFHPRWKDAQLEPARRFNTITWLDWAMSLSPRVSFTQDYLDGHDATILIRHG